MNVSVVTRPSPVLVVDDNPDARFVLRELLKPLGCDVIEAASGEDALRTLMDHDVSVVLLDVSLPGIDGFETARLIKDRRRTSNVPILFLTGIETDARSYETGYELGYDYMLKPVESYSLVAKVKALLQANQLQNLLRSQLDLAQQQTITLEDDINDRTRLLEQLQEERDRYETLLNAVGELGQGMVVTLAGRIEYANDAFCAMAGYTLDELKEMPSLLDLVSEDERGDVTHRLATRLAGGAVVDFYEAKLVRKDGSVINAEIADKLLSTRDGPRTLSLVRDVTERVRKEEERRQIERARDDALAAIAHDMRTPVTATTGIAQALLAGWDKLSDEERRDLVARIDHSGRRLIRLSQDVVDATRPVGQRPTLLSESFDVAALIRELCSELSPRHAPRVVLVSAPDEPVWAVGDEHATTRVLWNLLYNALKYSPGDTNVEISVTAAKETVTVTVRDHGGGIAPSDLPHLFERFYRGGDRRIQGSGLGLYVCKQLMEAQGGSIEAEVEDGNGAAFRFTLPAGPG